MTSAAENRTTELRVKRLRELLDGRGVEHYDHENGEPLRVLEKAEEPATSWRVDGASYCAVPDGKGTFDVWIDHCTPEQAIAATLGSEREKALEELVQDMWREITTCPDYRMPPCMTDSICERVRNVNAMLGGETCEMEYVSDFMSWHCKACDTMDMAPRDPKPRFCKWCGRKVSE